MKKATKVIAPKIGDWVHIGEGEAKQIVHWRKVGYKYEVQIGKGKTWHKVESEDNEGGWSLVHEMPHKRIGVAPKADAADIAEAVDLQKRVSALHKKLKAQKNNYSTRRVLNAWWELDYAVKEMKQPSEYSAT